MRDLVVGAGRRRGGSRLGVLQLYMYGDEVERRRIRIEQTEKKVCVVQLAYREATREVEWCANAF